jgi:hypothetical protein
VRRRGGAREISKEAARVRSTVVIEDEKKKNGDGCTVKKA